MQPTNAPFVYDRRNPPFFFAEPTAIERRWFKATLQNVSKEFFKLTRAPHTTESTLLFNGMTMGEYAMYIISETHSKRNENDNSS